MYFVADSDIYQERWTFRPTSWRAIGTQLRFSHELVSLSNAYQTLALGSLDKSFISIHVRHGDFPCDDQTTKTCFKSSRIYVDDAKKMRERLQEEKSVEIGERDVVVFSVCVSCSRTRTSRVGVDDYLTPLP